MRGMPGESLIPVLQVQLNQLTRRLGDLGMKRDVDRVELREAVKRLATVERILTELRRTE